MQPARTETDDNECPVCGKELRWGPYCPCGYGADPEPGEDMRTTWDVLGEWERDLRERAG